MRTHHGGFPVRGSGDITQVVDHELSDGRHELLREEALKSKINDRAILGIFKPNFWRFLGGKNFLQITHRQVNLREIGQSKCFTKTAESHPETP